MSFTARFTLFNVFTSSPTGGNPAAVVFLTTSESKKSTRTLQEIATKLDQPITVFLSHSDDAVDQGVAKFNVRWFTSTTEMPINGHGLIAAAGALFSQPSSSHKPDSFDLPPNTTTIQFLNPTKVPLNARRHSLPSWYEIELPASLTSRIPLDSDEGKRLCGVIGRALDRQNDGVEVYIKYIWKGGRGYENYLLVELDKKVDLEACKVDTNVLVSPRSVFHMVIFRLMRCSVGDTTIYNQRFIFRRTSRRRCRVRLENVCTNSRIT
jgi:hypothetical protein